MKHFLGLFLMVFIISSCNDDLHQIKESSQDQDKISENLAAIAKSNVQNFDDQEVYIAQQQSSLSLSENERNKALNLASNKQSGNNDLAKFYNNLGNQYYKEQNFEYALFYYLVSLDLKIDIEDSDGLALSYRNIALTYQAKGDYSNAAVNFWQSYYLYELAGDNFRRAKLLNDLGIINDLAHDFINIENFNVHESEALNLYEQSVELNASLGNSTGIIQTESNIGFYFDTYLNKTSAISSRTETELSRDQDDVEDEL